MCITISVHTTNKNNWLQKHICLFKQTIESDNVQLILIAAAVEGWNDNGNTNMFGFKRCLIKPIIMCIQVFKQTIILEQIKHCVEFLKIWNFSKENTIKYWSRNHQNLVQKSPTSGPEFTNWPGPEITWSRIHQHSWTWLTNKRAEDKHTFTSVRFEQIPSDSYHHSYLVSKSASLQEMFVQCLEGSGKIPFFPLSDHRVIMTTSKAFNFFEMKFTTPLTFLIILEFRLRYSSLKYIAPGFMELSKRISSLEIYVACH